MEFTDQLIELEKKYEFLTSQMADHDVIGDPEKYRKTAKAQRDLEETVVAFREYKKLAADLEQARAMKDEKDPELQAMAMEEIAALEPAEVKLVERLRFLLLPKDPNDDKNVLLEIRAGAGGDEAAPFGAGTFRVVPPRSEDRGGDVPELPRERVAQDGALTDPANDEARLAKPGLRRSPVCDPPKSMKEAPAFRRGLLRRYTLSSTE